jgi:hypothetical protein
MGSCQSVSELFHPVVSSPAAEPLRIVVSSPATEPLRTVVSSPATEPLRTVAAKSQRIRVVPDRVVEYLVTDALQGKLPSEIVQYIIMPYSDNDNNPHQAISRCFICITPACPYMQCDRSLYCLFHHLTVQIPPDCRSNARSCTTQCERHPLTCIRDGCNNMLSVGAMRKSCKECKQHRAVVVHRPQSGGNKKTTRFKTVKGPVALCACRGGAFSLYDPRTHEYVCNDCGMRLDHAEHRQCWNDILY